MRERQTLQDLFETDTISRDLRKGSSARHAIAALQTILHWLGFDRELRWARFGADGDYGAATAAAVGAFAGRNGSAAKGERMSGPLLERILARYDSLEELKLLAGDIGRRRIDRVYRVGGGDRIRIAALQTLLHDLGFDRELQWSRFGADGGYGRATTAAVKAFCAGEGLGGDGKTLTQPHAERIVARLRPFYGDAWDDPAHQATPAPGSLSQRSVARGNKQSLEVSDGVHRKVFSKFRRGLFTRGDRKPAAFVESQRDRLRALGVSASEINVMLAVSENEGNLDAINTWDNAFLSFGLFQWTAGQGTAKGELPALLGRVKREDRDLFDKYCGQHGLDVVETDAVYGYFSLRGMKIKSAAAKAQLREGPWAFYFWLAGQDPEVQAMEIKHALGRLDQFYSTEKYKVGDHQVSDLVTSEYGVGLILDNHVNRPAYVKGCLEKALVETGLGDPSGWGTAEERRLIDAYLRIRVDFGRTPMTDAAKRARVTKKYLDRGVISDRRGSFKRAAA